jgi:hypothetical protein
MEIGIIQYEPHIFHDRIYISHEKMKPDNKLKKYF